MKDVEDMDIDKSENIEDIDKREYNSEDIEYIPTKRIKTNKLTKANKSRKANKSTKITYMDKNENSKISTKANRKAKIWNTSTKLNVTKISTKANLSKISKKNNIASM